MIIKITDVVLNKITIIVIMLITIIMIINDSTGPLPLKRTDFYS